MLRSCLAQVSDNLWSSPVRYSGASWFIDLQTIFTVSVVKAKLMEMNAQTYLHYRKLPELNQAINCYQDKLKKKRT